MKESTKDAAKIAVDFYQESGPEKVETNSRSFDSRFRIETIASSHKNAKSSPRSVVGREQPKSETVEKSSIEDMKEQNPLISIAKTLEWPEVSEVNIPPVPPLLSGEQSKSIISIKAGIKAMFMAKNAKKSKIETIRQPEKEVNSCTESHQTEGLQENKQ